MAKKRPSPILRTSGDRRPTVLTIKGQPAWREWIERVAKKDRFNVSTLVDVALKEYAERHGHKPPPER